MEWPHDIQARLVSELNPSGDITNSDLEMAGMLVLFLIMEDVCGDLHKKHVALYSDNSPTVSWVCRLAARSMARPKQRGISINNINSHSLRSGGTNALALAGYFDTQI